MMAAIFIKGQHPESRGGGWLGGAGSFIDPAHEAVVEDYFLQLFRVDDTLPAIYYFAVRVYQHTIREAALPFGIDGGHQLVFVLTGEDIIRGRGLPALQEAQCLGTVSRIVGADAHQFKSPVPVHPVDRHQFREFLDTRSAPGGPNIDQPYLIGMILYQCDYARRIDSV